MADGISITLAGYEELSDKLKALEPKLSRKILRDAFKAIGADLLEIVRANAPQGDGDDGHAGELREAIQMKVSVTKRRVQVTVGASDKSFAGQEFYFTFNELGSSHQPARPFLRPALEQNKSRYYDEIAERIKAGLDELSAE